MDPNQQLPHVDEVIPTPVAGAPVAGERGENNVVPPRQVHNPGRNEQQDLRAPTITQ